MRKVLILVGFVIMVGPLFFLKNVWEEIEVEKNGKLVDMEIIDKPYSCLGTKLVRFMKVRYQGKIRSIQIGANYCEEHKIGEVVKIKYLEGHKIILLPSSHSNRELIYTFLISFFGLSIVVWYGLLGKPIVFN